jgi:hypothetical protein
MSASSVPRYRASALGGPTTDSSAYQRAQFRHTAGATHEGEAHATEDENEAILKALLKDVRVIKKSVTDVNQEVKSHLTLLDSITKSAQVANDRVQNTVKKLQEVSGLKSAWHVWTLVLVAFFVFVYLFLLLKSRGR